MEIHLILEKISLLPKKAREDFIKLLKINTKSKSYIGGVILVGMYLLELLGVPQLIDNILGEENKKIKELKESHKNNPNNPPIPSTGIVLCLVIADMIAHPEGLTRIYKIEEAAERWNTAKLMGIEPRLLNDDRILRALSSIGKKPELMKEILYSLTINTSKKFKIPLNRFFMDTTVVELDGEYKNTPKVMPGRGTNSFSQLIVSMVITATSKLPIGFDILPGKTADVSTFKNVFKDIEKVAYEDEIEIIADRAYGSAENIIFLEEKSSEKKKYKFIFPLKTGTSKKLFREKVEEIYKVSGFKTITYRSSKEEKKDKDCDVIDYPLSAYETTWEFTEKIRPDLPKGKRCPKGSIKSKQITVRCIIYKNKLKAEREKLNREKTRDKLEENLKDIKSKLNKRNLKKLEDCNKKVKTLINKYASLKEFINIKLWETTDEIINIEWNWNEDLFKEEEKFDGTFALVTNHENDKKTANDVIISYRERNQIEMNFRDLKGILDLEEMYINLPERIDAYVFLKVLACFVLTFLKFYTKEHGQIKTSEKKIQKELGELLVSEITVSPLEIPFYTTGNETTLTKFIRESFELPDPMEVVKELNEDIFECIDIDINSWYEKWKIDNI
jgi:transposase